MVVSIGSFQTFLTTVSVKKYIFPEDLEHTHTYTCRFTHKYWVHECTLLVCNALWYFLFCFFIIAAALATKLQSTKLTSWPTRYHKHTCAKHCFLWPSILRHWRRPSSHPLRSFWIHWSSLLVQVTTHRRGAPLWDSRSTCPTAYWTASCGHLKLISKRNLLWLPSSPSFSKWNQLKCPSQKPGS